ncbi:MAG: helix-turn-helix transcriptional regulator [Rhodobacter sp.]|nr:helix-turn-helix transcriptional regulator [Rhodobacter sp.]
MTGQDKVDFAGVARAHWDEPVPDWIAKLAEACAASSQAQVARKLGISGTVISQVLRRKYPGSMANVEAAFRGVYMRQIVECPALGNLPTNECLDWRRKARRFVGSNALRVQMFRACARCPLNRKGGTA